MGNPVVLDVLRYSVAQPSSLVQEFLEKHQFKCTDAKGKLEKNIRFREANFEFGEQIAVLGVVRNVTDDAGNVRKVLFPVSVCIAATVNSNPLLNVT